MSTNEVLLVRRAREGDASCFAELLELCASRALGAAIAILGNRQEAEEAVQDAAVEAYKSIRWLEHEGAFSGWFVRIVVNKSIDRLRKRMRERQRVVPFEEQDSPASNQDTDSAIDLAKAVSQLPPEHQAIIRLYYVEGYATPEIARMLDKPEGTVRRRLSESYRMLRLFLREEHDA